MPEANKVLRFWCSVENVTKPAAEEVPKRLSAAARLWEPTGSASRSIAGSVGDEAVRLQEPSLPAAQAAIPAAGPSDGVGSRWIDGPDGWGDDAVAQGCTTVAGSASVASQDGMQEAWSAVETAWARVAATPAKLPGPAVPAPAQKAAVAAASAPTAPSAAPGSGSSPAASASSAYMAWLLPAEAPPLQAPPPMPQPAPSPAAMQGAMSATAAGPQLAAAVAQDAAVTSRGARPPPMWGGRPSHQVLVAPEARSARAQQRAPPPSAMPTPPLPKPAFAPQPVVSAPRQPPMPGVFPGDEESDDDWEDPAGFDLSSMSSALTAASGPPSNASAVPVTSSWASLAARGPDPVAGNSASHPPRPPHRPPSLASAASSGSAGGVVGAQQAAPPPGVPPARKARQQPGAAAGGARQQPARSQQASRCAGSSLCGMYLNRSNHWRKQSRLQILCTWNECIIRNGALLHLYWNALQNFNNNFTSQMNLSNYSEQRAPNGWHFGLATPPVCRRVRRGTTTSAAIPRKGSDTGSAISARRGAAARSRQAPAPRAAGNAFLLLSGQDAATESSDSDTEVRRVQ